MRAWFAVGLALLGVAKDAAADPDIAWEAPVECPDVVEVRARITHRLGVSSDGLVHGIVVDVARDGASFVARVDLRGVTVANDVRTLTAPQCDELVDAVTVIIARVASEHRTAAAHVVDVDEPTMAAIAHRVDPPPPPRHRWGGGWRVLGLSGIGTVPKVGLGGEIAGYIRREALIVELAGARWTTGSARVHDGAPARVDVGLEVLALRAGWGPEHLPIRAWASVELGMMSGQGIALADPRVGSGRWTAAGAGFGVAWPMAPWVRLVGNFEVVVPFERVQFVLDDGVDVFRSWPISARTSLGLEVGWR